MRTIIKFNSNLLRNNDFLNQKYLNILKLKQKC